LSKVCRAQYAELAELYCTTPGPGVVAVAIVSAAADPDSRAAARRLATRGNCLITILLSPRLFSRFMRNLL
jgi:hypothetical protein